MNEDEFERWFAVFDAAARESKGSAPMDRVRTGLAAALLAFENRGPGQLVNPGPDDEPPVGSIVGVRGAYRHGGGWTSPLLRRAITGWTTVSFDPLHGYGQGFLVIPWRRLVALGDIRVEDVVVDVHHWGNGSVVFSSEFTED